MYMSKWKNSIPHEESEVEAEVAQVEGEDEEVVNVRGHLALQHLSFAMSLGQICVTIRLPDGLENKNFVIKPVKIIFVIQYYSESVYVCDITAKILTQQSMI